MARRAASPRTPVEGVWREVLDPLGVDRTRYDVWVRPNYLQVWGPSDESRNEPMGPTVLADLIYPHDSLAIVERRFGLEAHVVRDRPPDGPWRVDRVTVADPALLPQARRLIGAIDGDAGAPDTPAMATHDGHVARIRGAIGDLSTPEEPRPTFDAVARKLDMLDPHGRPDSTISRT